MRLSFESWLLPSFESGLTTPLTWGADRSDFTVALTTLRFAASVSLPLPV